VSLAVQNVGPEVYAKLRALDGLRVEMARRDINAFCEYVLQDERTGKGVLQSWPHQRWHELAAKHDRLLIWSHVESGKSVQIAVARTLWELGNNPELRFAICSNTVGQACKLVSVLTRYISNSDRLHKVFPDLQPGLPWTGSHFTVKRKTLAKDFSVQAVGVHGNILGSRIDRLILDDVLDYENTLTPGQRDGLVNWYDATFLGRLTPDSRVLCIGTAWHPEDMLHVLAKRWTAADPGAAVRFPIIDDDPSSAHYGQSHWPERWPLARIERRRMESPPLEFARQMLCVARDDEAARFKREYIENALRLGAGRRMTPLGLPQLLPGYKTYTGVDLAVSQKDSADLTVLFTILVHPPGSVLPPGTREVIDLESGRWSGPEIVGRIREAHRRYQSIVYVENNAAQDFIVQFTRQDAAHVPVRAFTTGRNKTNAEFGVESLATEMHGGKWAIPNEGGRTSPEVGKWIDEMLHYDPRAHVGDRLMASWFAREAARAGSMQATEPLKLATLRR
jgi:hypothetical protein